METLIARFDVTGADETPVLPADGDDAGWVAGLMMHKTYTAGIVGTGLLVFLHSGTEDSRGYLAAERITGTLDDGRSGSFTVHHGALSAPGNDTAFGYIIPGAGTGDFADLTGAAAINHDADGAYFVFELG